MAITVHELFGSRSSNETRDSASYELAHMIKGSYDDAAVRAALYAYVPATYQSLYLDNIQVDPVGGGVFIGRSRYSSVVPIANPGGAGADPSPPPGSPPPPPPPPAAPTQYEALPSGFAFDISGVAEHITQSLFTVEAVKRGGGVAPATQRAIGITADGEVLGVDVLVPTFEWSVTRSFTFITSAYLDIVSSLVGTTNSAVFYTWEPRRCLFLGAAGSTQNTNPAEVTFKFLTGKSRLLVDICDGLQVPSIEAHEYLWVSYKDVSDAGVMTMQPDAAYVEEIYDQGDFALLAIGE